MRCLKCFNLSTSLCVIRRTWIGVVPATVCFCFYFLFFFPDAWTTLRCPTLGMLPWDAMSLGCPKEAAWITSVSVKDLR